MGDLARKSALPVEAESLTPLRRADQLDQIRATKANGFIGQDRVDQ
jgi:hypothetical protein